MDVIISIGILLLLVGVVGFEITLIKTMQMVKEKEETLEYKTEETPKKTELTEEQKKKQEKMRESFENLMGYGYEEALKSKGE
jgi:flagellar biogenesis protein FliO